MLQQADFLHTNTFITIEDNYSAFSDPNILAPCLECLIFVINISETWNRYWKFEQNMNNLTWLSGKLLLLLVREYFSKNDLNIHVCQIRVPVICILLDKRQQILIQLFSFSLFHINKKIQTCCHCRYPVYEMSRFLRLRAALCASAILLGGVYAPSSYSKQKFLQIVMWFTYSLPTGHSLVRTSVAYNCPFFFQRLSYVLVLKFFINCS